MKKLIYKLLALLMITTWTACSPENLLNAPDDENNTDNTDPNKRELVITLQKELKVGSGAVTRGIATDEENEISTLDIYMFASASETGEYTFMKKYSYRSDPIKNPIPADAEEVKLQMLAGQPSVTLHPEKGTYVKLYCVANQPELYIKSEIMKTPDDGGDPAGTGEFEYKVYTDFKAFSQSAPGSMENVITPGVPTEEDFKKLTAKVIDPTDEKGYISPALVMSGATLTTIDLRDFSAASRLLTGIKLVRAVARFDVLNNPEITKFTIDSVAILNGRPVSTLFPIEAQKGEGENALIKYPTLPLTGAQPTDKVYPIFYSYGSSKDDHGELVLIGRYDINKTQKQKVSYKIPFMQKKGTDAIYLEINPNHRYTVEILEANPYELKVNFIVKEWDEGDNVDIYEPDNKVHLKLAATGNHANNVYQEEKKRIFMYINPTSKEGSIILEATSNSDITEAKIEYSEGNITEWIEMTKEAISPVTRAATGGNFKITLSNKHKPASDDGKRPIGILKIKNMLGITEKLEVIALPKMPGSNFKTQIFAIDDYLISFGTSKTGSGSYISSIEGWITNKNWRYPTIGEFDEMLGMEKPFNELPPDELNKFLPIKRNAAIFQTNIPVNTDINTYFPTSTTANKFAAAVAFNKAGSIKRTNIQTNSSYILAQIVLMKYDENQPNIK